MGSWRPSWLEWNSKRTDAEEPAGRKMEGEEHARRQELTLTLSGSSISAARILC